MKYNSDFNMRKGFYEKSKQSALTKKLKEIENTPESKEHHLNNSLHQYCRDVEYYVKRGWSKTEAGRYVKYWYRKRK